jgi:hypothetical protein
LTPEEILRIFSWPSIDVILELEKRRTLEFFKNWIGAQSANSLKRFLLAIAGVDGITPTLTLTVLKHQS